MKFRGTLRSRGGRSWTGALIGVAVHLAGCATPPQPISVSGFRPIQPALEFENSLPEVDSLSPTLKWEPYPGIEQSNIASMGMCKPKPFIELDPATISDVRYDLTIWEFGDSSARVYDREGLADSQHTVEFKLRPSTYYVWSVRARFDVNGQTRVSEWSLVIDRNDQVPNFFEDIARGCYRSVTRDRARAAGHIPINHFYRFRTPFVLPDLAQ